MTTATIFSGISYEQETGAPVVPAPTVVNFGAPVTRQTFTLSVTPSAAWAKASVSGGSDGANFVGLDELFVAPNGTGSTTRELQNPPGAVQYVTGRMVDCQPGASATLTVSY